MFVPSEAVVHTCSFRRSSKSSKSYVAAAQQNNDVIPAPHYHTLHPPPPPPHGAGCSQLPRKRNPAPFPLENHSIKNPASHCASVSWLTSCSNLMLYLAIQAPSPRPCIPCSEIQSIQSPHKNALTMTPAYTKKPASNVKVTSQTPPPPNEPWEVSYRGTHKEGEKMGASGDLLAPRPSHGDGPMRLSELWEAQPVSKLLIPPPRDVGGLPHR